jgi:signal transduction histidine kinase
VSAQVRFPGESIDARRARALRERVAVLRDARQRIIAAADEERRRIERDLHDGAQQRMVALATMLSLAEARFKTDPERAAELVSRARAEAELAVKELRDLARGIHPAVLSDLGLAAALDALAARAPVPVQVSGVPSAPLPAAVEAAAYFVTAEALTNVAKYARATQATVAVRRENGQVVVEVTDDGVGGADAAQGSGLRGLADRVAALDGTLSFDSPAGHGTRVHAEIPFSPPA